MKRFLAMLCVLCMCCMNAGSYMSAWAASRTAELGSMAGQTEAFSNKKKTKKVKATKTPKPTKTPKATKKPKATPEPTKAPKKTKKPKATATPEPTEAPKKTKKPKATATPEPTEAPKKTKKPKATATPEPTEEPKKTKKPKATATPEATEEPEPTKTPKATKTPKPTEEPTEAPTGEPTGEPTKAPTSEPTSEPTGAPTSEPTGEPTSEPTGEPTSEPTGEPTSEPTGEPTTEPTGEPTTEPTGEPTSEPTEAPTAEPTAEPTEEPTEEPTAEPTVEPTATPKPLKLKGLKASSDEVAPGKVVKFTFSVENAETVVWSAQRSDGLSGGSGTVKGGGFKWKPTTSGVYTVTVNASAGDMTASESCTVIVRAGALKAKAKADVKYAMVGGDDLRYVVEAKGGCEPYDVSIVIEFKGKKIYKSKELVSPVVCGAEGYGENVLTLTVTDATGATAKDRAVILSATNAKNDPPPLPRLSHDMTFAERLVAVANSQLGYRESDENFIVRDDHSVQGWSFYGGWYGMPYEEWCAMFVSYCLEKAGIDKGAMPRSANCNRWKGYLGANYIDDEDDYIPAAGDLIFFHHDRVSKDPNFPNHIGIVTGYDAEKNLVYTVEGNSGKSVRTHTYNHSDYVIVGYASMRASMMKHDKVYRSRLGQQVTEDLTNSLNDVKDNFSIEEMLVNLVATGR